MTIYLYIKEHTKTGLKYFGKTTRDPYEYDGSGTYWCRHIEKYGKDKIKTIQIFEFENQEKATKFALEFSHEHNIVESNEWANLVPENATGWGVSKPRSDKAKQNISNSLKGRTVSKETKKKISETKTGVPSKKKGIPASTKAKRNISKSLTGRKLSKEHRKKISEAIKKRNQFI